MQRFWTKRKLGGGAVTLVAIFAIQIVGALAPVGGPADLLTTSSPTLRKTLDYPTSQPLNGSNLDCTNLTYRLAGDTAMQSGCFTATTHGLLQSGGPVILNGTDEALPLDGKGYTLMPTPNQSLILAVSGAQTFGANVSFYNYTDLKDEYLMAGTRLVHYLAPTSAPTVALNDSQNQPVVINTSAMAFSSNGDWMVAESPRHAFIRVNLATFQITAFAPPFNTQPWDYSLPLHPLAISDDGRYAVVQGGSPLALKVYDLASCSGSSSDNLSPLACSARDYWPQITQAIPSVYGPYGLVHLRFVNQNTLSFDVKYNDVAATNNSLEQWQSAAYTLSADANGAALGYLALGDSYTSGEGTFNYVTGTDTSVNMCHLSLHAYPFLIGQQVFNQGHSVACSGATIGDLDNLNSGYYGQVADHTARKNRTNVSSILADFNPGYLAQLEFVKTYQPNVVSVSVTGNDIGYSYVLQQCAEPHLSSNTCYPSYEDKAEVYAAIDRKYRDLSALYSRLKAAAPHSTIYAIGYPQVAATGGDCALNVRLNYDEITFTQSVVNYLNNMIKAAAMNQGVTYVDISQALAGHRLCETKSFNVAMNGLTSGTDTGVLGLKFLGKESFHPNSFGHQLIANAILAATHNFAQAPPLLPGHQPAPDSTTDASLNMWAKTGRAVNQLTWDESITSDVANKGERLALTIGSETAGLIPNTTYTISLDRGGTPLGQGTTDSSGNLSTSVPTPVTVIPGDHTIDVTGPGSTGEPIDVSGPVYVPGSSTDYDGDGVPNSSDSCLTVPNAGVDADQDGIDDACDPLISQLPPSGSNPPLNQDNQGGQTNDPNPTDLTSSSPQSSITSPLQANVIAILMPTTPIARPQSSLAVEGGKAPAAIQPEVSQATPTKLSSQPVAQALPYKPPLPKLGGSLLVIGLWVLLIGPVGYSVLKSRFR